jgi:hypothetical protein
MGSDPPERSRDLQPSKTGEPTLWFDVVNENGPSNDIPDHFFFCFAIPGIIGPIQTDKINKWEITLRCYGGGVPSDRAFVVEKKSNERLMFALA